MHIFQVLKRPLITEKSTLLQEQNKYVFEVMPSANKVQVREAVQLAFEVKVTNVNMVHTAGENRRLRNGRWLIPQGRRRRSLPSLRATRSSVRGSERCR